MPDAGMNARQHPVSAAIGLGGNLGDAPATLLRAIAALERHPDIRLLAISSLYRSLAIGPEGQPDYANAVVTVSTILSAESLLDALQAVENDEGRLRLVRWGARTLDLDLLLYGQVDMSTPRLTIPHPEMTHRNFVLTPLAEIAANWSLPDGRSIAELAASLPGSGLQIWPDPRWRSRTA